MSAHAPVLPKPVELVCFALCVAHVAYLGASLALGHWLYDPDGQPAATDFVNVWAAGRLVLEGHAGAVYDWAAHKQAEVASVGHDFDGHFAWFYPPTFLFAATALAALPYVTAFVTWMAATFPAYLVTMRAIVGHRTGLFLACAFPPVLANTLVGQNGFLTAALLGGGLVTMERMPLVAGCLFGLLTYKPHLGFLIPLALAAGGYWRVFAAAAVSAVLFAAASVLAFGAGTWEAFWHGIPAAAQSILTEGRADFSKLQSVFGLVRLAGGSEGLAWWAQGTVIAACAIAVGLVWRSRAEFRLKAAALAAAALMATPYLYVYDLVALAVPIGFLIGPRIADVRPDVWAGFGIASLAIFLYPFVQMPVGLVALAMVAIVLARRLTGPRVALTRSVSM